MTKLLKIYLVTKWWIPVLFFMISIFLFLSDIILSNTNFGFCILILSGLLLFISIIWQLLKGKKLIALLQFCILIIPMFFFGFMMYLFAEMMYRPNGELAKDRIEPLIKEKTDLIIPKDYKILKNLIEHTEGAFDSDYSIGLTIEYLESDEKIITEQILKSMISDSDKGSWRKFENGFDFEHNNNEINIAEPFYFKVDTLNNKIELNLRHL